MTVKKKVKYLSESELEKFKGPLYVPGKPMLWVLSFGWAVFGYYVRHETPLRVRVAHGNFFRNAKKDYGRIAQEGVGPDAEVRYIGNSELHFQHIIRADEYLGEVPHGRIVRS